MDERAEISQTQGKHALKRVFDLIVGLALLVFFAPLLLLLMIVVRWRLGSPLLFRQERPGLGGEPFFLYKLRTMSDECDSAGNLLPDEARLGSFGLWLRSSSLDELPELWNVVRGEMSLVGPRPLRMDYLPLYSEQQARRHEVRPGITGWAQINGRNQLPWPERLQMDVWYVDNHNFWLDLRILCLTAWKVARRDDISAEDHVTMPPFRGER